MTHISIKYPNGTIVNLDNRQRNPIEGTDYTIVGEHDPHESGVPGHNVDLKTLLNAGQKDEGGVATRLEAGETKRVTIPPNEKEGAPGTITLEVTHVQTRGKLPGELR